MIIRSIRSLRAVLLMASICLGERMWITQVVMAIATVAAAIPFVAAAAWELAGPVDTHAVWSTSE